MTDNEAPQSVEHLYADYVHGTTAERAAMLEEIQRLEPAPAAELAKDICAAIEGEYAPSQPPDKNRDRTRSWLLCALGRLANCGDHVVDLLKKHADPDVEHDSWARYWLFEGMVAAESPEVVPIAKSRVERQDDPRNDELKLDRMLALAILANSGDEQAERKLAGAVQARDWNAFRALRVVHIESLQKELLEYVATDNPRDLVYDAVAGLLSVPAESPIADEVSKALVDRLESWRSFPYFDSVKVKVIEVLAKLGQQRDDAIGALLLELKTGSPTVVRDSARALRKLLRDEGLVERIVKETCGPKADETTARRFADALRSLDRETAITKQLSVWAASGTSDERAAALRLLYDVGGTAAFERIRALQDAQQRYDKLVEESQANVQEQYNDSVSRAKKGFDKSMLMTEVLFWFGLALILGSALTALIGQGDLAAWAGLGGGAGVLSVLFTRFVDSPRKQVTESVEHLAYIDTIYLGYFRQLQQIELGFMRHLLEKGAMVPEELDKFRSMTAEAMDGAVGSLGALRRGRNESAKTGSAAGTLQSSNGSNATETALPAVLQRTESAASPPGGSSDPRDP